MTTTDLRAADLPAGAGPEGDAADSWRTDSVGPDEVTRRLDALWRRGDGPRPRRLHRPGGEAGDHRGDDRRPTRAHTYNLLVCGRTAARSARAAAAVAALPGHHPTRVVALYSDPTLDRPSAGEVGGGRLRVRVGLARAASRSGDGSRYETVAVVGGPRAIGSAGGLAFPLCVPDLPTVLWWAGDPRPELGVFTDLASRSDHVIVDSAASGDVGRALVDLAGVSARLAAEGVALSDLAWARTGMWRTVIAQFFDAPPVPDAVHAISGVEVAYDPVGAADTGSGMAPALLVVGWLATRLGWEAAEPLARTPDGVRMVFRAPHHRRPVVARLVPAGRDGSPTGLDAVMLRTDGPAAGEYSVRAGPDGGLTTRSEVAGLAPLARHVMMAPVDEVTLLSGALAAATGDAVAAAARVAVADLLARRDAPRRAR